MNKKVIISLINPIRIDSDMKNIITLDSDAEIDNDKNGLVCVSSDEKEIYIPLSNLLGIVYE